MLVRKTILAFVCLAFTSSSFAIPGYVTDSNGKLHRDSFGHCVKTGTWEPKHARPECDVNARKAIVTPEATPAVVKPVTPVESTEAKPLTTPVAPAVVESPKPVKGTPINLNATLLFAFDRADLLKNGETLLSMLVNDLKNTEYSMIRLDGYTDRFGSANYNFKLSQRRADAVKAYLVNQGIPASKITTAGHGKTAFITNEKECAAFSKVAVKTYFKNYKGKKKTDTEKVALKSCYSQDRRVTMTLE
jgi:OmpA-OmpF porin, OOP family